MLILLSPCFLAVLFVETPLATTKNCTVHPCLVTLTIFFQTFRLLTLTPFFHLLVLHSQTKPFVLLNMLRGRGHLKLEPMSIGVGVASKGFNDGLLVLYFVGGVVAAVETVAGF